MSIDLITSPDNASFLSTDGKNFFIFVSWRGGYVTQDCWRSSTFIKKFEVRDDYILAETESGTRYILHLKILVESLESCRDLYHRTNLEYLVKQGASVETLEAVINNFRENNNEQTV